MTATIARASSTFRVIAICFAIAMIDGFDTLVVSFIGPALVETWQLAPAELGRIFGAGLMGAALGGMTAGVVADRLGRKRTLLACIAVVLNLGGVVGALLLTTIIDKVGAFRAVAIALVPGAVLVAVIGAGSIVISRNTQLHAEVTPHAAAPRQ